MYRNLVVLLQVNSQISWYFIVIFMHLCMIGRWFLKVNLRFLLASESFLIAAYGWLGGWICPSLYFPNNTLHCNSLCSVLLCLWNLCAGYFDLFYWRIIWYWKLKDECIYFFQIQVKLNQIAKILNCHWRSESL